MVTVPPPEELGESVGGARLTGGFGASVMVATVPTEGLGVPIGGGVPSTGLGVSVAAPVLTEGLGVVMVVVGRVPSP